MVLVQYVSLVSQSVWLVGWHKLFQTLVYDLNESKSPFLMDDSNQI